jgi:hypothetical protein
MRMARRVNRAMPRRPLLVAQRNGMRVCAGWVAMVFSPDGFVMLISAMFVELCSFLLKNVLLDVRSRACWLSGVC